MKYLSLGQAFWCFCFVHVVRAACLFNHPTGKQRRVLFSLYMSISTGFPSCCPELTIHYYPFPSLCCLYARTSHLLWGEAGGILRMDCRWAGYTVSNAHTLSNGPGRHTHTCTLKQLQQARVTALHVWEFADKMAKTWQLHAVNK